MRPLHKVSHAGQGEATFSFITLNAGNRAQDAIPLIAGLQAASNSSTHPLRPTLTNTKEVDDTPLPAAELSVKTYNALIKGHITTLKQFCAMELSDLKWLRNFGKKAEEETIAYRARLGAPVKS